MVNVLRMVAHLDLLFFLLCIQLTLSAVVYPTLQIHLVQFRKPSKLFRIMLTSAKGNLIKGTLMQI